MNISSQKLLKPQHNHPFAPLDSIITKIQVMLRPLLFFAFCTACLWLTACTHPERERIVEIVTPTFEPTNFGGIDALPDTIHRIAVMPIHFGKKHPRLLEDLNPILQSELNKKNVAEIVPIEERYLVHTFNKPALNSTAPLPHDFFELIQQKYAPDAILLTDITHYHAYKPMSIGMRCKLVTALEGKILWSFDMVFDSGDPMVAASAKSFERRYNKIDNPMSVSSSILQSPNRFAKYITHAMFTTFPVRKAELAQVEHTSESEKNG